MVAPIVQVPASTNVTTPVEAFIVHTDVVELEYVLVPAPADAVDVIVGGVALPEYEALYEPASIVSVPASTNVTTPVDEFTVQTDVVELV